MRDFYVLVNEYPWTTVLLFFALLCALSYVVGIVIAWRRP